MKLFKLLTASGLSLLIVSVNAQTSAPKGYSIGTITLANNNTLTGMVKDNISRDAAVGFFNNGKETIYYGTQINAATTINGSFICIRGDFFKVISNGTVSFLQKSSDASSQPNVNGTDVQFTNGTEGNQGDYFVYNSKSNELKLVSKKTLKQVVASTFEGYAPAVEKAKAAQNDIVALKDAVEVFNSRL
jgi:hypothetical protein